MKNISIQLNKKTKALGIEHPRERFLMQVFLMTFIIFLCAYLYLVSASVMNVMARREAMQRSTSLEGAIGSLEQQYFALSENLTTDAAASLQLTPLTGTSYVHRPGAVGIIEVSRNAI